MLWVADAFAAEAQTAATTEPAPTLPHELSAEKMMTDNLLILGMLFFIFYFILIRPQQRRIKAHREMLKELKRGDKVMTNGGIIGSVAKFEGDTIVLIEIAPETKVRVARSAISEIMADTAGATANDN